MLAIKEVHGGGRKLFEVPEAHVTYQDVDGLKFAVVTGWNYVCKSFRDDTWGWTKTDTDTEYYLNVGPRFIFVGILHESLEDELSMFTLAPGNPSVLETLKANLAKLEAQYKEVV